MDRKDKIKIAWINLVYCTSFSSLDEVPTYFLEMANLHSQKAHIEAIVVNATTRKLTSGAIQRICGITRGRIKLIRDRLIHSE
jgi:hypothetical protein